MALGAPQRHRLRLDSGWPPSTIGWARQSTSRRRGQQRKNCGSSLPDRSHAQDQERRRIARELHDTTAQNMTAISMNLARLERAGVPPAAAQILADCQTLCDTSLREIRTLSYLLHPPMLDEVGLVSACAGSSADSKHEAAFVSLWTLHSAMERLPAALERDLFFGRSRGAPECRPSFRQRHRRSSPRTPGRARRPSDSRRWPWNVRRARQPEPPDDWAFVGVGIPSMRERLRQNGGGLEILSNQSRHDTSSPRCPFRRRGRIRRCSGLLPTASHWRWPSFIAVSLLDLPAPAASAADTARRAARGSDLYLVGS